MKLSILFLVIVGVAFVHANVAGNPVDPDHSEYKTKICNDELTLKLDVDHKNTSCNKDFFHVKLTTNKPFYGIIYAKGFPKQEVAFDRKDCFSMGKGTNTVDIVLDSKTCGVRMIPINDFKMAYTVTLVMQTDRFLQQITNKDVSVTCLLPSNEITIGKATRKKHRESRKMGLSTMEGNMVDNIKSWMEIKTQNGKGHVAVGNTIKVFVKTELPRYMSASVISCSAYDGLDERSQVLTDSDGCSLDTSLMPPFIDYSDPKDSIKQATYPAGRGYKVDETWAKPTLRVSGTTFTAFKFSDANNLHLKCTVIACRFGCHLTPCDGSNDTAELQEVGGARILDSMTVFNSIEVNGPGIDYNESSAINGTSSELFCLPPNKIAFAFALAGAFFLFGVIAAVLATLKPRRFRFFGPPRRVYTAPTRLRGNFNERHARANFFRQDLA